MEDFPTGVNGDSDDAVVDNWADTAGMMLRMGAQALG